MNCYTQLSQEERYIMSALMAKGFSVVDTAKQMNRSPSTLYRERKRNARKSNGFYTPSVADNYYRGRRRRRRGYSHFDPDQWTMVQDKIEMKWSPEQISNVFKQQGIMNISYQTIYRRIIRDRKRGGNVYEDLRIMPKVRRKKRNSVDSRGILPGKRPITDRPTEANTRAEIGHWEGDTVMGGNKFECVLTLVDRKSGYAFVEKITHRTAENINSALRKVIKKDTAVFKTITFDNGTEFHSYKEIETEFKIKCYFAQPHHPWERGCNENFNGLLRQYLPKGASMHYIGEERLNKILIEMNNRPRKRLSYKCPQEIYFDQI